MKKIIFTLCFLQAQLFAQYANLNVSNPRAGGFWNQGTIEEALFVVDPVGGYAHSDFFLTLTSNLFPNTTDSLEVRLYFSLPHGSFITDLWLWIGEDTSVAILADRYKAQATYNTIVGARKDPALLTKEYGDYYSLSIFPLPPNQKRKIKISYSTPLNVTDSAGTILLPYWILKASAEYTAQPFRVLVKKNDSWTKPTIKENNSFTFSEIADSVYGNVLECKIPRSSIAVLQSLTLQLQRHAPILPWFAEKMGEGSEGIYRFSLNPFLNLGINTGKKILFLVDYDSTNVNRENYTKRGVVDVIRASLKSTTTEGDSFNVIFSDNGKPYRISNSWLSSDSGTVEQYLLSNLPINSLMDTVDLAGLLFDGIDFIEGNGNAGNILLIASSDEYTDVSKASKFLDALSKKIPPRARFFAIDYNDSAQTFYSPPVWQYSFGNSFLYQNLANETGGSYSKIYWGTTANIRENIQQMLGSMKGFVEYFDMNVYLDDGFTYMNYSYPSSQERIYSTDQITQVGKFTGSFPLNVLMTGIYDEKLYQKKIAMQDSNFVPADSGLYRVWISEAISYLESDYSSYNYKEITRLSLENRILSSRTAFLALEPGQKLCDTCIIGSPMRTALTDGITNVKPPEQVPEKYEALKAYPNPFNPTTTLRIQLPKNVKASQVVLAAYNILGQQVKRFDVESLSSERVTEIVWDATSDEGTKLASGVYFVIMTTPVGKYAFKVMLLK